MPPAATWLRATSSANISAEAPSGRADRGTTIGWARSGPDGSVVSLDTLRVIPVAPFARHPFLTADHVLYAQSTDVDPDDDYNGVYVLPATASGYAALSGSGAAVFGAFGDAAEARQAAAQLRARGLRVWVEEKAA